MNVVDLPKMMYAIGNRQDNLFLLIFICNLLIHGGSACDFLQEYMSILDEQIELLVFATKPNFRRFRILLDLLIQEDWYILMDAYLHCKSYSIYISYIVACPYILYTSAGVLTILQWSKYDCTMFLLLRCDSL